MMETSCNPKGGAISLIHVGGRIGKAKFVGYGLLVWCLGLWIPSMPFGASPSGARSGPVKISLQETNASLDRLLGHLAEILHADIHVVENIDTVRVKADFRNKSPLEILSSLLRGYSYAVVYHQNDQNLATSGLLGFNAAADATRSGGETETFEENKEAADTPEPDAGQALQARIHELEAQIESGYADRWYEHWSNIKDEKYLRHPREELEDLQGRVEELEKEVN
jgi:hypothetical protein